MWCDFDTDLYHVPGNGKYARCPQCGRRLQVRVLWTAERDFCVRRLPPHKVRQRRRKSVKPLRLLKYPCRY